MEAALDALQCDPGADRLFAVGDLIDRGPDSPAALDWLEQGRILSVRGNHEQYMINNLVTERGWLRKSGWGAEWVANGGGWFRGFGEDAQGNFVVHDVEHWNRREAWLRALHALPFLRTVETAEGTVGIAHTLPNRLDRWQSLEEAFQIKRERARDQRDPEFYPAPGETLWARGARAQKPQRTRGAAPRRRHRDGANWAQRILRARLGAPERTVHRHRSMLRRGVPHDRGNPKRHAGDAPVRPEVTPNPCGR